ncbi:type I restriction enzyme HsdR N-terminal domain-containing protein [Patescibacteria group bacterium]|nr:type I restriction enzyme HsdR N-terminal domain-containing protein [Patescibacteria group bacterium]
MSKWITKQDILDLIKGKHFKTEDEFRDFLAPQLVKLLGVKSSQIVTESDTTSFDSTLSNRADIVVRTDDQFQKAIIVIELKLRNSIEKYKNGDYLDADKQLHKYCQDTRAPYGILLTDDFCAIYKNKYFSYNQKPKREKTNRIPSVDRIEDTMAFYALLDFLLYKKSMKYLLIMVMGLATCGPVFHAVTTAFGWTVTLISAFIIGLVATAVLVVLALVFKIFD